MQASGRTLGAEGAGARWGAASRRTPETAASLPVPFSLRDRPSVYAFGCAREIPAGMVLAA